MGPASNRNTIMLAAKSFVDFLKKKMTKIKKNLKVILLSKNKSIDDMGQGSCCAKALLRAASRMLTKSSNEYIILTKYNARDQVEN